MDSRFARIRAWTLFLIAGLVLSGLTAFPIRLEVEAGVALLGKDLRAGGLMPDAMSSWLRTIRDAVRGASEQTPLLFYGTDWLAYGHLMIALVFVGALRDPVRNRWLYTFGMVACALVPLWALIFGQLRGIPFWWRGIDSMFGVVGFIPASLCHRWTGELEREVPGRDRTGRGLR